MSKQISAYISDETQANMEHYSATYGVKKGFLIENALNHYLQALYEIPEEFIIPTKLVLSEEGFEKVYMEVGSAPEFKCTCNREKMAAVLRSLPIPERMELVRKKEPVAIRCQFCNDRHELSIDECIAAWNAK